jgi:hypothetical protein
MFALGTQTPREDAGLLIKPCIVCLTTRLHAVAVSNTVFAGFTTATHAYLTCAHCGLEREVSGEDAETLLGAAVTRAAIVETLRLEDPETGLIEAPAGTEWLIPPREAELAA